MVLFWVGFSKWFVSLYATDTFQINFIWSFHGICGTNSVLFVVPLSRGMWHLAPLYYDPMIINSHNILALTKLIQLISSVLKLLKTYLWRILSWETSCLLRLSLNGTIKFCGDFTGLGLFVFIWFTQMVGLQSQEQQQQHFIDVKTLLSITFNMKKMK